MDMDAVIARLNNLEVTVPQERAARTVAEQQLASLRAHVDQRAADAQAAYQAAGSNASLASSVAQAVLAAQAASTPIGHSGNSSAGVIDSRAFAKLDKFRTDRARWHDWSAVLQSYVANANEELHQEMLQVEGVPDSVGNAFTTDQTLVTRSKALHLMLTMIVEGSALYIVLNAGHGEGYEAWRRLVLEFDPRSRVRAAGSMMDILAHQFVGIRNPLRALTARFRPTSVVLGSLLTIMSKLVSS